MVETIFRQLFARIPKRTQEVLWRRFGLKNNRPETLEAIGRDFKITRERVRQIEARGLLELEKHLPDCFQDFVRLAEAHLSRFGGVREEKRLLEELSFATREKHPAAPSRVRFLLSLSDRFAQWPETKKTYAFWAVGEESGKKVLKFLDSLIREIKRTRAPFQMDEVSPRASAAASRSGLRSSSEGTLVSYVAISKELAANPFGHLGHIDWPEIVPRGVKDRAYLVLKHANRPIHFKELAKLINDQARRATGFHQAWQKPVEVQTVHNELIKDGNFVLVGRGIYALKEWGYEPGTVRELIARTLKGSGRPLSKEEVIRAVKERRVVQENTILINLQNRRFFERLPNGRYRVRGHTHLAEEI